MRLPTQHRRETPELLALRREMRGHGVVLRRERGADHWRLYLAPPRAWNLRAEGTLATVEAWYRKWRAERNSGISRE